MMGRENLMTALLLASLLLTGLRCKSDAVFVYSRLGGDVLLPCINPVSQDCSSITWTFYKGSQYTKEVSDGHVRTDSVKSSRMSITPNCSLTLRDLSVDDAGSYVCLMHGKTLSNVYLSLLTITSLSKITDLQPGGTITLSCILFTYYDIGSCTSSSRMFNLSWVVEEAAALNEHTSYQQIVHTRCNITLVAKLQSKDNNRKWRCQVNAPERGKAIFLEFTSTFLFQYTPMAQNLIPSDCPVQLPISRILLCVALTVMVLIVGFFTWRGEQKSQTSAAGIELREI